MKQPMHKIARVVGLAMIVAPPIWALVGPRVDVKPQTKQGASKPQVLMEYPMAHAGPGNGGAGGDDWKKKFCAMLGVETELESQALAECKLTDPGSINAESDVCISADDNGTSFTGPDNAKRKCEYCVRMEPEEKCNRATSIKAKLKAEISFRYGLIPVKCKAGAEYSASAQTSIFVTNSEWKAGENNTEGPWEGDISYWARKIKPTASSQAQVKIEGGCEVLSTSTEITIEAECAISQMRTYLKKDKRVACGKTPDAGVAVDASVEVPTDSGTTPIDGGTPTPIDGGTATPVDSGMAPAPTASASTPTPMPAPTTTTTASSAPVPLSSAGIQM